jgi:predicted membrane-bound spermidine synthase
MVVTAFMLGLGLGRVTGGAISKDPRRPALLLFSLVELGIGAFGFFSLPLFRAVGRATLHMPPVGTGLVTFLLVLAPTMLMGGTLPLLVGHMVRVSKNVGKSVGTLHFVNTLGSALASFAAPLALLGPLGQSSTVRLAAALNVVMSVGAFLMYRRAAAVPPTRRVASVIDALTSYNDLEDRQALLARTTDARVVTDDNMVPEWREPLRYPDPP